MNKYEEIIQALQCNGKNLENCRKCNYVIFTDGGMPICNRGRNIYAQAANALTELQAENISLRAECDALLKSFAVVSQPIEVIQPKGVVE